MSQVIARRYRPQTFDEVIGQEPIVRTLRNQLTQARVGHGYIFAGHRGIGKTTVARLLAKAMNCRAAAGPTATPCGECEACREIRDGNAVDVIEVDAASNRGIEEIRALRERVRYRPARDRYKVFILDEAHQLTDDAFNALLKTLEEPPEWALFVLATTEPDALPATIRSRCQLFTFRAVPYRVILEHLGAICAQEKIAADPEALGLIAEAGEGSVRDALSLLEQAIAHGGESLGGETVRLLLGRVSARQIGELLEAVTAGDSRLLLQRAATLLATGCGPAALCRQLAVTVRNALVARTAGAESELLELTEAEREVAVALGARCNEEELTRFLQIVLRTAGELRFGQQERLHFELGLMKLLHSRRLSSVEDVLAALGGEGGGGATPGGVRTAAAAAARAPEPVRRGIPEATPPVVPKASIQAPTASSLQAPMAPSVPADPTQAVLQQLERSSGSALASVFAAAQWEWEGSGLRLVYAGAALAKANLAELAANRKLLVAAIAAALQRGVTLKVERRESAPAAAAAQTPGAAQGLGVQEPGSDTPERRAAQHPLLQELRAAIPAQVLATRPLQPRDETPHEEPREA